MKEGKENCGKGSNENKLQSQRKHVSKDDIISN